MSSGLAMPMIQCQQGRTATEVRCIWSARNPTFEVNLACTSKRLTLTGEVDSQGVMAKDLAYLLMLAYENGSLLTLYHRNGASYTVAIETLEAWNPSPLASQEQQVRDEEYIVKAILRQVA